MNLSEIEGTEILVIDPPWKFGSNSKAKPGRNAMRHYECMTDDEIAAIPIKDALAKNALVFCWTTVPMQFRSFEIVKRWGLKYKSELIWNKGKIATGFWVRNQHEPIWILGKGRFPCPNVAPFRTSIIEHRAGKHSEKPEALQDMIDATWPDAIKAEMFARRRRPGWACIGNEVEAV